MSCVLDFHNIDNLPSQSLTVKQCGYQQCNGGHSCGPLRVISYSITFVLKGCGIYRTGGRSYSIHAGQGFIMILDETVSYKADEVEPWSYIYTIFYGIDSEALLCKAGLDRYHLTFDFEQSADMLRDLQAMYTASRSNEGGGYDVLAYFLLVMSRLIRCASKQIKQADLPDFYMQSAIAYIADHYPYHITLNDITKYLNIDRTYLHKLFIRRFGTSPMRWLNDFRLQKAVELMGHKNITVSEIALSTGFYDLSHFNRVFINKYNMTPGSYKIKNFIDKLEK